MSTHHYRRRGRYHDQYLLQRRDTAAVSLAQTFSTQPVAWACAADVHKGNNDGDIDAWPQKFGLPAMSQPTASKEPELQGASWPNGGAAVYGDGVGEAMLFGTNLDLSSYSAVTVVIAVYRPTTGTFGNVFMYGPLPGWAYASVEIGINGSDLLRATMGPPTGQDIYNSAAAVDTTKALCYAFVLDRASFPKIYDKDGAVATSVAANGTQTGNYGAADTGTGLFSSDNGTSEPWDGWLREIVIYPEAMSEADAVRAVHALCERGNVL